MEGEPEQLVTRVAWQVEEDGNRPCTPKAKRGGRQCSCNGAQGDTGRLVVTLVRAAPMVCVGTAQSLG